MSHKKYRQETNCLNCGAEVLGRFCQNCGQENLEIRENFFHIATHTVGDFFHYDSKFFRSFGPLLTKPGFLTKQYWEGKRMHFIHPLRLFFFVTIIMVIVANAYYKKYERQIKDEKVVRTGSSTGPMTEEDKKTNKRIEKKLVASVDRTFDAMALYLKYISFLLLPVYAFGFKLLYVRSKRFYIDHLVYTLHLQSFIYIIISLVLLIPLFILPSSREWFQRVVFLIAAVYLLISLRYVYKQSWIKTILKSALAFFYMLLVTVIFIGSIMALNVFLLS